MPPRWDRRMRRVRIQAEVVAEALSLQAQKVSAPPNASGLFSTSTRAAGCPRSPSTLAPAGGTHAAQQAWCAGAGARGRRHLVSRPCASVPLLPQLAIRRCARAPHGPRALSLRVLGFGSLLAARNSGPEPGVCAPALIWPARGSGQGRQRDSGLGRERNRGPDDGGCDFRVKFVRGLGSEWQPSRHLTYRSQWQISLGFEGPLEAITQRASLPVCRLDADGRWRTINAVCSQPHAKRGEHTPSSSDQSCYHSTIVRVSLNTGMRLHTSPARCRCISAGT